MMFFMQFHSLFDAKYSEQSFSAGAGMLPWIPRTCTFYTAVPNTLTQYFFKRVELNPFARDRFARAPYSAVVPPLRTFSRRLCTVGVCPVEWSRRPGQSVGVDGPAPLSLAE
ncbi:hypothetical protein EVAR_99111_1 [Eumeta japonica]|uniref:Uncharacterized protein n=1 Tax=Eumeta variegata TaxID=151549 RepID=A0A4C1Z471_EUMVA|nr:hypothetical protein EVAR_99111_1 [Eumeta japonica]